MSLSIKFHVDSQNQAVTSDWKRFRLEIPDHMFEASRLNFHSITFSDLVNVSSSFVPGNVIELVVDGMTPNEYLKFTGTYTASNSNLMLTCSSTPNAFLLRLKPHQQFLDVLIRVRRNIESIGNGVSFFTYPPVALTTADNLVENVSSFGIPHGNGLYSAKASSIGTGDPFKAFNKILNVGTDYWMSALTRYDVNGDPTGSAATTVVDSVTRIGEWLELSLPQRIKLSSIKLTSRNSATNNRYATHFMIVGSNDLSTWTELLTVNDTSVWDPAVTREYAINSTVAYLAYKYIVLKTVPAPGQSFFFTTVAEWELFGTPLDKFPPVLFPSSSNVLSLLNYPYGNGTYTASSSSFFSSSFDANRAFNQNLITSWRCATGKYGTDGSYLGSESTLTNLGTFLGETLTIEFPEVRTIKSMLINTYTGSAYRPLIGYIVGRTLAISSTWTVILQTTNWNADVNYKLLNMNVSFKEFRLIARTKTVFTNTILEISEWYLYSDTYSTSNVDISSKALTFPKDISVRMDVHR